MREAKGRVLEQLLTRRDAITRPGGYDAALAAPSAPSSATAAALGDGAYWDAE